MRQRAKLRKRVQTILINKERFSKELHCLETEVHSWVQIKLIYFKSLYFAFSVTMSLTKSKSWRHNFFVTNLMFKSVFGHETAEKSKSILLESIDICDKIVKLLGTNISSNFLAIFTNQVSWERFDSCFYAINIVSHVFWIYFIHINWNALSISYDQRYGFKFNHIRYYILRYHISILYGQYHRLREPLQNEICGFS